MVSKEDFVIITSLLVAIQENSISFYLFQLFNLLVKPCNKKVGKHSELFFDNPTKLNAKDFKYFTKSMCAGFDIHFWLEFKMNLWVVDGDQKIPLFSDVFWVMIIHKPIFF